MFSRASALVIDAPHIDSRRYCKDQRAQPEPGADLTRIHVVFQVRSQDTFTLGNTLFRRETGREP